MHAHLLAAYLTLPFSSRTSECCLQVLSDTWSFLPHVATAQKTPLDFCLDQNNKKLFRKNDAR